MECDSIYILNLTIANFETNEFTVSDEENCDSYLWDPQGREYTTNDAFDPINHVYTESGTYHRTYKNQMDCDSVVTMHIDFDYTPHPTEIYPMNSENAAPHWVITATEFQINSYDFYLWDTNPSCDWDSVAWSFETPMQWVLEPFGEKCACCKVYVLNQVNDTVWLKAQAFNRCSPEGVEQRYWLICSFYGVEESGSSMGLGSANFEVFPNPNSGQMTLQFERLTGKINIKVYDMTGALVDNVQTYNKTESNLMQYNLKGGCGVYFFVVTGKEGVVTKKVIIR